MSVLRNTSLSRRLLLVFALVIALTAIPLGFAVCNLREASARFDRAVAVRAEAMKQSARLHRNLFELRTQEKESILADDAEAVSAARSRIAAVREESDRRKEVFHALDLDNESRANFAAFDAADRAYDAVLDRVVDLANVQSREAAHALSHSEGRKKGEEAAAAAIALTHGEERKLAEEQVAADQAHTDALATMALLVTLTAAAAFALVTWVSRGVAGDIGRVVSTTDQIASGDLDTVIDATAEDEVGLLARSVQRMQSALRSARKQTTDEDWLRDSLARVNTLVLGQTDPQVLADSALTEIARLLDAKVGALFTMREEHAARELHLLASYAYTTRKSLATRFRPGEGLVGQAALERKQILLQNAPEDYVRVVSGLGDAQPRTLCVTPFLFKGEVLGVLELGMLGPLSTVQAEFLTQAMEVVAAGFEITRIETLVRTQRQGMEAFNTELQAKSRALAQSQAELEAQQQRLRETNAELEAQVARLEEAESRVRVQQEEMGVTNHALLEKNRLLERLQGETEAARVALTIQAEELTRASRYKSEFLANMSHELRTPLNSLLLLARSLRNNAEGNLTTDQVESAGVIYDSGSDLLNLINEILDLSKIEAGRMELHFENVALEALRISIDSQFSYMARSQGITWSVRSAEGVPDRIRTDPQRLGQVLKNLVGNALKFTDGGEVSITFASPEPTTALRREDLSVRDAIAIHVSDTGIGIPPDKQQLIFEAFQQADSGDRRRYGGTGLGLSISRELAGLLGGEIQLTSEPGKGSTFTLYLPIGGPTKAVDAPADRTPVAAMPRVSAPMVPATPVGAPRGPVVDDDRNAIGAGDAPILIVEDDARFARILVTHVRRRGLKTLVALTGEDGLSLARTFRPGGVVLDLQLPNMDGWQVLSALKQDVETRHIPVHIVSVEESSAKNRRAGAVGHAAKPLRAEDIEDILSRIEAASASSQKRVLVVEDNPVMRAETVRIVGNGNVAVVEAATGEAALTALRGEPFALVLLDLGLPDMNGLALLERATGEGIALPPIIVHTVRNLTPPEELKLRDYAASIIVKSARSQERLVDEVALFLHRIVKELPDEKRRAIWSLRSSDQALQGKKVLVVEDDMRTMFGMCRLLAEHGIQPIKAENGQTALEVLEREPDVDMVLMDMMMPVLDGYEATRRIRAQARFERLPILALTAKAMKEDRQRCLDAGVSDYLTKPVEPERLLSLMRVWMTR